MGAAETADQGSGDKITIGTLENATGVAIGAGAQANVTNITHYQQGLTADDVAKIVEAATADKAKLPTASHSRLFTRPPFEPETVPVLAGPFVMGNDDDPGEGPRRTVDLPAYYIGKTPITNDQYALFLKHNAAQPEPNKKFWFLRKPKKGLGDHPVVNVTWHDTQAYCAWLRAETGQPYRLPSEAEWEKAARGPVGWIYPWGDDWQADKANVGGATTTPVTQFVAAASPSGCLDMLGNVEEWTASAWGGAGDDSLRKCRRCRTGEWWHPEQSRAGAGAHGRCAGGHCRLCVCRNVGKRQK